MNQDVTAGVITGEMQKKNTGLIAGMVVCAILAVGDKNDVKKKLRSLVMELL